MNEGAAWRVVWRAILLFFTLLLLALLARDCSRSSCSFSWPCFWRPLPARFQRFLDDLVTGNPELTSRLSGALPTVADLLGGASGVAAQAPRLVGVATGVVSGVLYVLFTMILALYLTMSAWAHGRVVRRCWVESSVG